jgi:superfamily II DNA or RNA helicase
LLDATVRLGFSGAAQLHKDPTKNKMMISFLGPIIYTITNKERVDMGVTTKPIFKIFTGTQDIKIKGDYKGEYDKSITLNKARNKKVWKRVIKHKSKGRLPLIILYKFKEHAVELLKHMPEELKDLSVDYIHSGRSKVQRKAIIDKFKAGKLDVLLASYVLKRGKNLPLIRVLINAGSGDSHINALQILGRLLRKHESKDVVWFEDFFDKGAYLQRHSKHRIRYYKQEGFEVKELYKR